MENSNRFFICLCRWGIRLPWSIKKWGIVVALDKTSYGTKYGGGIYCNSNFATILADTIIGNSGNGIYNVSDSSNIKQNIIMGNAENGIYSSSTDLIFNNVIEFNELNGIYSESFSIPKQPLNTNSQSPVTLLLKYTI